MKRLALILFFVFVGFFGSTAPGAKTPWGAAIASEINEAALAADPVAEKRLQALSEELRCLVCQNQTIADSNAELAQDLRNQVRDMLRQGKSEAEILAYMTQRYGDFVLYRPPVKSTTTLLWFGPALLLIGCVIVLMLVLRRRSRLPDDRFEADVAELPEEAPEAPAR